MFELTCKYTMGVINRKPNSVNENFVQFYNDALGTLSHGNVVIAGGLNLNLHKCNNAQVINTDASKFVNINASLGFIIELQSQLVLQVLVLH